MSTFEHIVNADGASSMLQAHPNGNGALVVAEPLPAPRCSMHVRSATTADLPFIDALQKMHSHMVGFIPLKQFEKHIADGNMLIAEELAMRNTGGPPTPVPPDACPMGYVLAKDQYLKRDDVGIVYQLNVMPLRHRHLVGASLIKAVFEKAAYGCRLFSCWCAQDIQANWFWESLGFVPLAFRTGSRAKQRTHIFWQRRVRHGADGLQDEYPYWFPSKTEGGAVMEDRIVLPIPLGTHWRDAKPLVLPGLPTSPPPDLPALLPGGAPVRSRPEQMKITKSQKAALMRSQSQHLGGTPLGKKAIIRGGRIRYIDRPDYVAELDAPEELIALHAPKPKKPRAPRQKHDPKFIAAARELRDRYLDEVNSGNMLLPASGKYEVGRQLPETGMKALESTRRVTTPLLEAA